MTCLPVDLLQNLIIFFVTTDRFLLQNMELCLWFAFCSKNDKNKSFLTWLRTKEVQNRWSCGTTAGRKERQYTLHFHLGLPTRVLRVGDHLLFSVDFDDRIVMDECLPLTRFCFYYRMMNIFAPSTVLPWLVHVVHITTSPCAKQVMHATRGVLALAFRVFFLDILFCGKYCGCVVEWLCWWLSDCGWITWVGRL